MLLPNREPAPRRGAVAAPSWSPTQGLDADCGGRLLSNIFRTRGGDGRWAARVPLKLVSYFSCLGCRVQLQGRLVVGGRGRWVAPVPLELVRKVGGLYFGCLGCRVPSQGRLGGGGRGRWEHLVARVPLKLVGKRGGPGGLSGWAACGCRVLFQGWSASTSDDQRWAACVGPFIGCLGCRILFQGWSGRGRFGRWHSSCGLATDALAGWCAWRGRGTQAAQERLARCVTSEGGTVGDRSL